LTDYRVQRSIQRRLAAVRTDLDSFSDAEAYALMASGYLMTEHALREPILGFALPDVTPEKWKFLQLEEAMRAPNLGLDSQTWLQKQLSVADKLAFRVWYLSRPLQIGASVVAAIFTIYFGVRVYNAWDPIRASLGQPLFVINPTLSDVANYLGLTLLSLLGFGAVAKLVNYRKTVQQFLIGFGMGTIGFLFARLHLHVFDRLFLRQGRIPTADSK